MHKGRPRILRELAHTALPTEVADLLTLVAHCAQACNVPVWLVGGVIRDLLLDQPLSRDLDLAVEGEVTTLATQVAEATGGRVMALHAAFGTATVLVPGRSDGASLVLDFAQTRVETYAAPAVLPDVSPASLEHDLVRRDFSVNALAVELQLVASGLHFGRRLDLFGGEEDLAQGRLRLLHAASLRDDPTRMLRGLRLASRLGLHPEPATRYLVADAVAQRYLMLLSPERVLHEVCLALAEPDPAEVVRLADQWEVTPQILPGLTWDATLAARCTQAAAAVSSDLPLTPLVWAGLLLYGCSQATLDALAQRYPLPGDAATLIRQLPEVRKLTGTLAGMSNSALDETLRLWHATTIMVHHYAVPADRLATTRYLRELRTMRAPLDGNDLQRLGVLPGPLMGQILHTLRQATLDGIVASREEAETWVRRFLHRL
ncbi:CCA tRNA nucleotidyltransferase [Candidatus Chloroploca sp. Khr17]|uniref:CCA tRNA nucleotidyltransferase n=1 Tax=Candidatus Chloroploca sp. Khr17 TaxID=2496869 RepID=UPI00101D883C|nr:CCA tRNA nucleotidyltransferase [Candidatus Chloroploca sp. Khr17]